MNDPHLPLLGVDDHTLIPLPDGRWPEAISTMGLIKEVERFHYNASFAENGDLRNRLWAFDRYELQSIEVAKLNTEGWKWSPEAAQRRRLGNEEVPFPPIVIDPKDLFVIDGSQRVHAALHRGDTLIWAYVGIPKKT